MAAIYAYAVIIVSDEPRGNEVISVFFGARIWEVMHFFN